jgi:hypothetical protein
MGLALLVLASFSPDDIHRPEFGADPKPYVTLMILGFAVGIFGHLIRSRVLIAVGVGAVFLGTFLLPVGIYISKS